MLFTSSIFSFLFLPITLLVFAGCSRLKWHTIAKAWLIFASFVFYGYWNVAYLSLIIPSMLFNYGIGVLIGKQYENQDHLEQSWKPKILMLLGIAVNLVLLAYFKYANFILDNINTLFGINFNVGNIILPLGISFFTFQKIAYLVDSYRGNTKNYNLLDYSLFVIFFPQLIAGPIVHHGDIVPQFAAKKDNKINWENISIGVTIFALGLFKKVIFADTISAYSTPMFNAAEAGTILSFYEAWAGLLAYTLQLYFDFSGYSDMAIGLARMFGIILPVNFNSPYQADSIIEFWRRWHITLSNFLRDYLYIPLGGNRKGNFRRYLNLMITMLLGGLWHGANWTFVIWGGLHGLYLVINNIYILMKKSFLTSENHKDNLVSKVFNRGITFLAVIIAWIFFRAESIDGAINIFKSMLGINGIAVNFSLPYISPNNLIDIYGLICLLVLLIIVFFIPNTQQIMSNYTPVLNMDKTTKKIASILLWKPNLFWAINLGLILFISLSKVLEANKSEFLYFQF
ncbi:MBOAT family protein [Sphaerospermopsis aphanizomenoides BCCUSP55]|uniref:MBOAT family O-acyltransferase n=1 Tax=Sphaerospermopsis aphanizomenoides TaxID=459663 RepID=UPI001905A01E|nr:MBOAT family protein [Sphaerospermopsis aphanizomenoides]MBK1990341.1 MBOAT family protein [Sphaerospermopsis aphanizomenoides BCCUSP55]